MLAKLMPRPPIARPTFLEAAPTCPESDKVHVYLTATSTVQGAATARCLALAAGLACLLATEQLVPLMSCC